MVGGKLKIAEVRKDTVVAYFDLEFCNECKSRQNYPIAIGVSYRRGSAELYAYHALIWIGDELTLWKEQLARIGYDNEELRRHGRPMEEVTEELLSAHERLQPKLYVSYGSQDEKMLLRHASQSLDEFHFRDGLKFLSKRMSMKCEVSLEKYAYICGMPFVHQFQPLEDARCLAGVLWRVLHGNIDEGRRQEVLREYEIRLFLSEYKSKRQAAEYLESLGQLTPKQQTKRKKHREYLAKNAAFYKECLRRMQEQDS